MTKVTSGWNLPIIPGTVWDSSNIPNPIYNLNKREFHTQFAHVDFVWAPFSHRSDTLVLGIEPRWSSPNLRPLYWRLAPAEWAAAKFFTWGLKSSSSDLCHSAPGLVSAQRSPVTVCAGFQVATLQTLSVNTLNAELSRILWISEVLVILIITGFHVLPCGVNDMLLLKARFPSAFVAAYFWLHFLGVGHFTTPVFAFVAAKLVENATGLLKMMGVRAGTSIYQLSVSQAAFKNHYSLIQRMCQGHPAG